MNDDTYPLAGRRVHRVGYGAMQLPGPGVFGPPRDRQQALDVLRYVVDAGVNHVDTAYYYGLGVANELIREALHPYPDDLVLVSKVGARRDAGGGLHDAQRPEQLREGVLENLTSLDLDQVPVVNLRRHAESDVPFDEQVATMVALRDEGLIGAIGLSNVTPEQYRSARASGSRQPRSPWPGCCSGHRTCCSSRAPPRSRMHGRTWLPPAWNSTARPSPTSVDRKTAPGAALVGPG